MSKMSKKNPVMVAAGVKSWETRRANERKEMLSRRAYKAAATRKKNAKKTK